MLIGTGQVLQPNVRRWRAGHKGGGLEMTQSCDQILAGDAVVNHDGMRDSAGTGGRVDIDRKGARPIASVAGDEELPGAVRPDPEAIEGIDAERQHVLVVGAGDDPEQLDLLRRRQRR